ncbi:MAG: lasso peptide biosynthesis B2 protein [Chloroflexi bacterium]|nr:MAG: lasso peptide biosynthesis B2 protein [Chloroflexota bacterium]
MGPLRKLWRLPGADRILLSRTVLWLAMARVGLWVLPLRSVRRLLARAARGGGTPRGPLPSQERIVWAVGVACRVIPGATCLPQALATEALFLQSHHPADLRIGVLKPGAGRLLARLCPGPR